MADPYFCLEQEVRVRDDAESVPFLRGMRVRIEVIYRDNIVTVSVPSTEAEYNVDVLDLEELT